MAIIYLETYPGTITMRNPSVYEGRLLGIYAGDDTPDGVDEKKAPGGGGETSTAAQTLLFVPPRRDDLLFAPTSASSHDSNLSIR